jgi:hypothetical protein
MKLTTHHLLLIPRLKLSAAIPTFPYRSSWHGAQLSTGTTLRSIETPVHFRTLKALPTEQVHTVKVMVRYKVMLSVDKYATGLLTNSGIYTHDVEAFQERE